MDLNSCSPDHELGALTEWLGTLGALGGLLAEQRDENKRKGILYNRVLPVKSHTKIQLKKYIKTICF